MCSPKTELSDPCDFSIIAILSRRISFKDLHQYIYYIDTVEPLIADMLYSGHISMADTFSRSQLVKATGKLLYFEPLYSGHLSIADTFSENQWCPLFERFHCI